MGNHTEQTIKSIVALATTTYSQGNLHDSSAVTACHHIYKMFLGNHVITNCVSTYFPVIFLIIVFAYHFQNRKRNPPDIIRVT